MWTPKPKQKKALYLSLPSYKKRARDSLKNKPRQKWRPVASVSKFLSKLKRRYNQLAKQWKFEHPFCEFCRPIFNRSPRKTTEVHHKKGRGKYLLDVATFGAACHECHMEIHRHPEKSYENGWMLLRNSKETIASDMANSGGQK